ncbi:BMP family ABC transporter substrate-binding protein [Streptomyces sp. RKAG293]|uniref:BMP family ABC transporter substrate-binding protein n=1 Tax=Streptomyces sp. RKAG293 TaxID=2893403 RepID=UPI0020342732|nr:BMP family ABC transporter substrate-binding protein [Streptomyces sp. RKAG293]MCM2418126.1 BMP family ABC transporter substrate-binding protein [Streptomyces sp. RKAG293]
MKWKFRMPQRWVLVSSGAVAVAVAVTAVLIASLSGGAGDRQLPPSRAREYSAQQACLLTPAQGLADAAVKPVWAGMQGASATTKAQVSYLAVAGEQTAANAAPYLAALAARHCNVVLTVGAAPAGAVTVDAARFPATRFLVVGDHAVGANVSAVVPGSGEAMRSAVESAVLRALRG